MAAIHSVESWSVESAMRRIIGPHPGTLIFIRVMNGNAEVIWKVGDPEGGKKPDRKNKVNAAEDAKISI